MSWFRKTPEQVEIGNWYVGWHSWKFEITYNCGGFIHENHYIDISLFGWHSRFILPWKANNSKCTYDSKEYGISIHDNAIFFHCGYDLKSWGIPFFNFRFNIQFVPITVLNNATTDFTIVINNN